MIGALFRDRSQCLMAVERALLESIQSLEASAAAANNALGMPTPTM